MLRCAARSFSLLCVGSFLLTLSFTLSLFVRCSLFVVRCSFRGVADRGRRRSLARLSSSRSSSSSSSQQLDGLTCFTTPHGRKEDGVAQRNCLPHSPRSHSQPIIRQRRGRASKRSLCQFSSIGSGAQPKYTPPHSSGHAHHFDHFGVAVAVVWWS